MTNGIFAKAISNIVEAQSEKKHDGYTMINVRPGEKISAMLDVIAYLNQKSPSGIIADALSQKIADHAASSALYADAILEAATKIVSDGGHFQKQSALGILENKKLIRIINPFMRNNPLMKNLDL
jgi:glutaredoxin 2